MSTTDATNDDASKDVTNEKSYWNSFYAKFNLAHPSQFCVLTAMEVPQDRPLIEFACGNARDSIYLASKGFRVYACDLSKEAIEKNSRTDSARNFDIDFMVVDASNSDHVQSIIKKARTDDNKNVTVYSRFFLHSIDKKQEDLFLNNLSSELIAGDEVYFEFRSKEDQSLEKFHGKGHYRRYIDTPALVKQLSEIGFETFYEVTGQGMAKYKNEDPFVSRIMFRKP